MSYALEYEDRKGYLYARATGTNSRDNFTAYFTEVVDECDARGYRRVLIDDRLEGPSMGTFDLFESAVSASRLAFGRFSAMAYVDRKMTNHRALAEHIGKSRGLPVVVFDDLTAAEAWIAAEASKPGQP